MVVLGRPRFCGGYTNFFQPKHAHIHSVHSKCGWLGSSGGGLVCECVCGGGGGMKESQGCVAS